MKKFDDQIVRLFKSVDFSREGDLTRVLTDLKSLGWKIKKQFNPYGACYDSYWEPEEITKRNDGKRGAAIMSHYFFTLYRSHEDCKTMPEFVFTAGRMGNTMDWLIDYPEEYSEERQDVIDQQLLF